MKEDKVSPFFGLVHIAGPKSKGSPHIIKQKSLYDAVKVLYNKLDIDLKQDANLTQLPQVIMRYFNAVSQRWPLAWKDPKKYLLMTSTGLHVLASVGATLIGRLIPTKSLKIDDFLNELKSVQFSWEKKQVDGTKLVTGRSGAEKISEEILTSLTSTKIDLGKLL